MASGMTITYRYQPPALDQPVISSTTSFTFNPTIINELTQAKTFTQGLIAKPFMVFLSEVKWIRGITAKPNCKLSTTWLRINNPPSALSPNHIMVKKAGIMASKRVISLRNQGCILSFKWPSITICPASVPVTVELCPAAISAIANRAGATLPKIFCNNLWASWISATSCRPFL
ncbi:hypothetical protein D3C85_1302840 [compost metagenome]